MIHALNSSLLLRFKKQQISFYVYFFHPKKAKTFRYFALMKQFVCSRKQLIFLFCVLTDFQSFADDQNPLESDFNQLKSFRKSPKAETESHDNGSIWIIRRMVSSEILAFHFHFRMITYSEI